ncbi:Hypothetical protein CAP_2160 [Chondromyces apiculatus DSM 436]|uniref:MEMO1 family protein CAP_2160 n=1 Tax=Chondromyces apiculatus DSM 436 TaxID=1192034 RepID=A0A017TBH9_9BACT|nr:Hypothetical protein CAP_2160 [Chondromyces apiculatus DSM 436]
MFYPGTSAELSQSVDALLGAVSTPRESVTPKALIVPHAGYIYSGPVAASAYATLRNAAGRIRRVVLLGPAHRVYVQGLVLPEADALETPLGNVRVDREALAAIPWVKRSAAAHLKEHSLEVQLPFLIRALGDFALVPLCVGDAAPEEVARTIEALWGGDETLVVVSSDLSHYLPYAVARALDGATAEAIVNLTEAPLQHEQACGATPVNGLLVVARKKGMRPEMLDLRSSGDTAGGRAEVVGYGAFAFYAAGSRETQRGGEEAHADAE